MTRLVATATVSVADPDPVIAAVCDHLAEHDAKIARDGAAHIVDLPFGTGTLRATPGRIELGAEAADITGLYHMRMALAGHVKYFAKQATPEVVWTGDGSDLVTPPNYRVARVRDVRDITPHMRRITFVGADLDRFATNDSLHLGLAIPPEGGDLIPPTVGRDGLLTWGEADGAPDIRRYTTRRCDPVAGELDIDFVLHEDAGPGAAFAARAKSGDRVGLAGPMGGAIRDDRDWYLIGGDETALPAIARSLETFPASKRGLALIEIAGPDEAQAIDNRTSIEIRWLYRNGAGPGARLADAVRETALPDDGTPFFIWTACEFAAFKVIRNHLRKERGLTRDQHLAVAYWRREPAAREGDGR
ncbi:siderophore-interacting protein [Consotaella aegiceratis]|uniref:siderophore-interacting protein n=1 Tax=Consotaella aegiceratis TaxID=3097961 RepID=UPI002F3EEC70